MVKKKKRSFMSKLFSRRILLLIQFIVSIIFLGCIYILKMLPMKYYLILCGIIFLLWMLSSLLIKSGIKKKKRERQIILVTHNPNIVVGADSEEVIVANQNGKNAPNENGIKFQYVFGSLENSKKRVNQMGQARLKC